MYSFAILDHIFYTYSFGFLVGKTPTFLKASLTDDFMASGAKLVFVNLSSATVR